MTKSLRVCSLPALCLVILAAGCGTHQPTPSITGNWSFKTQAALASSALTLNAGLTSQINGEVSGVAHLQGAACVPASTNIALSGSIHDGQLSLKSVAFDGTTLTIKGTVGADGKSFNNVSLAFAGGACSSLGAVAATTTQYAQINGTYSGTFADYANHQATVTAQLTQTTQPDANGQFHLSGSATFPNDPCFTQPLITDSLVTGQNLSTTYVQGNATIQAVGVFNSDATQLTVTQWTVTGGQCDGDYGTGLLTKQ